MLSVSANLGAKRVIHGVAQTFFSCSYFFNGKNNRFCVDVLHLAVKQQLQLQTRLQNAIVFEVPEDPMTAKLPLHQKMQLKRKSCTSAEVLHADDTGVHGCADIICTPSRVAR